MFPGILCLNILRRKPAGNTLIRFTGILLFFVVVRVLRYSVLFKFFNIPERRDIMTECSLND